MTDLSDANGFDSPSQYRTIRAGDVTGTGAFDIVARTAGGVTTWGLRQMESGADHWVKLSDGPALTGPVWAQASHYDTIRLGGITGRRSARRWSPAGCSVCEPLPGTAERSAGRTATVTFQLFRRVRRGAYAEVSRLLLGREGDFRKLTYASPNEAITEATLNDYRTRLAERCTPLVAKRGRQRSRQTQAAGPPRYTDCRPPGGSDVDPAAWTAVSNQIIAELWAASGVVAHFTILDAIETKLFQDQQGTLPALDTELTLPPNPPNRSPTYLKLTKGSLDILKGLVDFFPVAVKKIPHHLRAVALTGNVLGAVADGLGLSSSPSPPSPYGRSSPKWRSSSNASVTSPRLSAATCWPTTDCCPRSARRSRDGC